MRFVGLLLFVAGCVVACGGASSSGPSTAKPSQPQLLPSIDMRFVASDGVTSAVGVVVHADGRVERPGKQGARIVDGRLLCDDGSELVRVEANGDVVFAAQVAAHLSNEGVFAMDHHFGSWSITVRDDGDVELTTKHEGKMATHDLRWDGFRPEARRTASLLSGFLSPSFGGAWCGELPAKKQ